MNDRPRVSADTSSAAATAFEWIVGVLGGAGVPFQVTGGLAARAYGATRPLVDIDLNVHADALHVLAIACQGHVTFGPGMYRDEHWELPLLTLRHGDQLIDVGGDVARIFDRERKVWVEWRCRIEQSVMRAVLGLRVPVEPIEELVRYKAILGRPCDEQDIAELALANPGIAGLRRRYQ